jgi:surface polysaccharide O-acyltransferase-like enzyme
MVIVVHCTEPFYIGGSESFILTGSDAFWASFFDSFVRACVPMFVVASSYLLFPTRYTTAQFLKKRTIRVLVPFLIWSLIYALAWGDPVENLKNLLLNFNYSAGHLWFVYMLIGVYLLIPLLSPWAEKVEKKELLAYLGIWMFSNIIPLIRDYVSADPLAITYGPSGIPRQALFPLWGEASWNTYGTFYYISGFIGYLLLGLYFRRFVQELSWKKTLAISLPCWVLGFAITFGGFLRRVYETSGGVFPTDNLLSDVVYWETTWYNDTIGVALMTISWILLFRKIRNSGTFYQKILLPLSEASYGTYLSHMLVLVPVAGAVRNWLGSGESGVLGFWTTPVEILLSAILTFTITSLLSVLIKKSSRSGKWIVG